MNSKALAWRISLFAFGLGTASPTALANWTLNIGYHNPVHAQLGVNLLYWSDQWNFEIGLGWIDGQAEVDDDTNEVRRDDDRIAVAGTGDIDFKYHFGRAGFAPYLQVGFGAGTSASVGDNTGAAAALGGSFAGLGLMLGKPGFYGYAAYNILIESEDMQVQAGLGFDI